ncbi:MAG TPA: hypothetical protein VLE96_02645 [Chlamydiales bacterium]|nr:hypothetical protein [Chlamydiales bacterium]
MSTLPLTSYNRDIGILLNAIGKISDNDMPKINTEIEEGCKDIWKINFEIKKIDGKEITFFNRPNEKLSYGLLMDVLITRIVFYAKNIPSQRISNPPLAEKLIYRHNLLVKLQRALVRNFQAWNELYNQEKENYVTSLNSLAKNFVISIKLDLNLTEVQYKLFYKLMNFGPIKLKSTYTHNYMLVLPPKESDLKKLKKIEKEHFKRTL